MLFIESIHELLPIVHLLNVLIPSLFSLIIHTLVDILKTRRHTLNKAFKLHSLFLAAGALLVPQANGHFILLKFLLAEMDADRDSSKLPMVELMTGVMVITIVNVSTDSTSLKKSFDLEGSVVDCILIRALRNGHDHHLNLRYFRGQYQAVVIRMNHNHGANTAS